MLSLADDVRADEHILSLLVSSFFLKQTGNVRVGLSVHSPTSPQCRVPRTLCSVAAPLLYNCAYRCSVEGQDPSQAPAGSSAFG